MKAFLSAVVVAIVIAVAAAVLLDVIGMSTADVYSSASTRL